MKGSKNRSRPSPVALKPSNPSKSRLKKSTSAPAPPASTPPASSPPVSTPSAPSPQETVINESPSKTDTSSSATEIDLECKETAPIMDDLRPILKDNEKVEMTTEKTKPSSITTPKVTTIVDNESTDDVRMVSSNEASCDGSESVNNKSIDSLENENDREAMDLLESKRKNPDKAEIGVEDKRKHVFGIRKSPFHPSVTIHNSGSDFEDSVRLMNLSRSNPKAVPPSGSKATVESGSISRSPKKKAKGLSLMIKQKQGPFQANNTINNTQLQQATYFNNAPQQMQYGTRLMINEPIYLPRSVATIAPITTTLQQIANQARRPPFLSKKAEAYLAYQEDRKLNYMASNYTALVKIAKYLDVKDLLNLRLVNKSWKSIVGNEDVWRTVKTKSSIITDWQQFTEMLCSYHTKELIFTEFEGVEGGRFEEIFQALLNNASNLALRTISIQTVEPSQHTNALEFLYLLRRYLLLKTPLQVIWRVRVAITEEGLAIVHLKCKEGTLATDSGDLLHAFISDHDRLRDADPLDMEELQMFLNRTSFKPRFIKKKAKDLHRPTVRVRAI